MAAPTHACPGVNEIARNVVVAPSPPYPAASQARAVAIATVVPFNYSGGGKTGGP